MFLYVKLRLSATRSLVERLCYPWTAQTRRQYRSVLQKKAFLLEPGIARRIGVGAYDKSEPEPEFTLNFEPEDMQERVRVAFDQMKIPGTKRTLYFCILLNTGNKRCRATIALRNTGER